MLHAPRARTWAVSLSLVAILATAAAAQTQEDPAFAGAGDIRLGDDVQAVIRGFPGEIHQYTFFATAGSRLSATLVTDKGSSLLADVRLTFSGGEVISDSTRTSRSNVRKTHFPEYTFATSGVYVLEVVRRSGSGGYQLDTKARRHKRIRGLDPSPGSEGQWRFDAPANSELKVKIRVPRAHVRGERGPLITGLTGPDGQSIHYVQDAEGQRTVAKHILLTQHGTYTVFWANPGNASRLRFKFELSPQGGGRRDRLFGNASGTSPTAPEVWDPARDGRDDYVGSAACAKCHDQLYREWSRTAHNLGSREWMRGGLTGVALVNDANRNGQNDFLDGLDLGVGRAFSGFGDDAPVLSWVDGDDRPARVRIGDVTYTVERTLGGNGVYQQTYAVRIGDALYPMPFEYDEQQRVYVPFESDFWYDEGGAARYTSADQIGPEVSYEARCAGCHGTGLVLETDAGGAIVAGYVDGDVGCEQCHGPGGQHASTGNPAFIANPASRLDGSADGVRAANETCTRCHDRGHGLDPVPGSDVVPAYPYNAQDGVAQYGDDRSEFFELTDDPDDFVGYKGDLFPDSPGVAFLAGRSRAMQGMDLDIGAHTASSGLAPTCFECHTPHRQARAHMLETHIDRGLRIEVQLEDNTFCLACHAEQEPFEKISLSDVDAVSNGVTPASVSDSVVAHMRDIGMGLRSYAAASYDPTGTGVGRCDTCHMPEVGGSTSTTEDQAGFEVGDRKGHRFQNIWPNASELYGVTNSCNSSGCHPTYEEDPVQSIIEEWARPDEDGDTTFHADTPLVSQDGVKNPDNGSGGVPCVSCHTTDGFVRIQVRGEATDQDDWRAILENAIGRDVGITCRACHGRNPDGEFANTGLNPLRFPKEELCGLCHNDETIKFADFRDDGEIVRHPQREMILGTAGEPVPDSGRYEDTAHSLIEDGCVSCHFNREGHSDATHAFQAQLETCATCHDGLDTFDRPAFGDYDGNGEIEGIQTEVSGLLDVLVEGLLEDPDMRFENGRFEYGDSNDGSMDGASEDQKRAAFNYYSAVGDASLGVHNTARTVQLLQRSYESVTGEPVPGADLR
jgi:hypothetical protein